MAYYEKRSRRSRDEAHKLMMMMMMVQSESYCNMQNQDVHLIHCLGYVTALSLESRPGT